METKIETNVEFAPGTVEPTAGEVLVELDAAIAELDLPELADTMEDADARVATSRYLGAMRNVQSEWGANEAEYKTLAAFERRRQDERQGPLERQLDWLHGAVKTLFGFMRPSGKKKSLNLIAGRVGMRAQTDELVVDDDDAVIAYAKEHRLGDLVRITYAVNRKCVRAHLESLTPEQRADPELSPPGCRLEKRPDQFYATPATD